MAPLRCPLLLTLGLAPSLDGLWMTLGRPLVSPGFQGCHVPVDPGHRIRRFRASTVLAEMHNATKPNNAWWRWIRSEQRNTPVMICLCRSR